MPTPASFVSPFRRAALIGALLGLSLSGALADDDADKRARDEKRHLSAQITQLNRDVANLRAQLADEKAHSEELLKHVEDETAEAKANAAKVDAVAGAAKDQLQKAQSAYEDLHGKYDELNALAGKIDGERREYFARAESYQKLSEKARQAIRSCVDDNRQLAGLGNELIDKYKQKDFVDLLSDKEPFFQFSRAKLESLLQDYEDKIYDHTQTLPTGTDQPVPAVPPLGTNVPGTPNTAKQNPPAGTKSGS